MRPIIVGLDFSPESRAAAHWAAAEAARRKAPLRLVYASELEPRVAPSARSTQWALDHLEEVRAELLHQHPALEVDTELIPAVAAPGLLEESDQSEVLVLGSRGRGALHGFLVGSIGQKVLARATRPIVLVRARSDENSRGPELLLGLDGLDDPAPALLEFAFLAATVREAPLRVAHAWTMPRAPESLLLREEPDETAYGERRRRELADALRAWREKYPDVTVTLDVQEGNPAEVLLAEAPHAALLIVGRRTRRPPLGPRIGSVTHAVLHHATAPVAVIAHE